MKLLASLTSPYARKVRIALAEKKIEYALVEDSPWDASDAIADFNPLGKIPVLVLDDGTTLFDSRVIVEYLDAVSPVSRLIPEPSRQRIAVKRWEALADGICDAAMLITQERKRAARQQSKPFDRASGAQDRARRRRACARARGAGLVQRRRLLARGHRDRLRARLSRPPVCRARLARPPSEPRTPAEKLALVRRSPTPSRRRHDAACDRRGTGQSGTIEPADGTTTASAWAAAPLQNSGMFV